jgi:hypothetical protein
MGAGTAEKRDAEHANIRNFYAGKVELGWGRGVLSVTWFLSVLIIWSEVKVEDCLLCQFTVQGG